MKALIFLILSLTVFHSTSATSVFVSNDTFYHVSLEPLSWFAAQEVRILCKLFCKPHPCFSIAGQWEDIWAS